MAEDSLVRRFEEALSLTNSVKGLNPMVDDNQLLIMAANNRAKAAANHRLPPIHPAAAVGSGFGTCGGDQYRPSPYSCRVCRSNHTVGRYVGDSRWSVTCLHCHESFLINQCGGGNVSGSSGGLGFSGDKCNNFVA